MNEISISLNDIRIQEETDLFPELATSLLFWIDRLHRTLLEERIEQVYFLSREGQPLMRLFEMYSQRVGVRIKSHYLEVSRRSTLLPSLLPLAEETFDTLFRQYRNISLFEFLSSLGLDAHIPRIALMLGLPGNSAHKREQDFPTSTTFESLKALPDFQGLYEQERVTRRRVFIEYLKSLSGGGLPERLVVVDVGWKGTIQDNLFALLCRSADTPVKKITGYYIGLVAEGGAETENDKYGLLFSAIGRRSPKFRIFNENRALFEVLLAADHGSIISYESAENNSPYAVRGTFEEEMMLEEKVFPLQHKLFERFSQLLEVIHRDEKSRRLSLKAVAQAHARMVFNPTDRERAWFSSVFHVENYGVFERSNFFAQNIGQGLVSRLCFLINLLRKRSVGALGFWPWHTIYERGGALPAVVYGFIRRLQC